MTKWMIGEVEKEKQNDDLTNWARVFCYLVSFNATAVNNKKKKQSGDDKNQ
jgi:hypothetical protein